MAFSALAVVVFFRSRPGLEPSAWKSTIAPSLGFAGLLVLAIYATYKFGFLIGSPGSALGWALPALIPLAAVVGVASAAVLRSREPAAFDRMGRNRALQLHE
jgi:hypothetical protein